MSKRVHLKDNTSIVHIREWGVGMGVKKSVILCGRQNFMIPNVTKVIVLALVQVLQWNSQPHFSYMYFQNEKYFDLQKWHQNVQLQVFIQANVTVGEKAKKLARTTTPAKWQFYKGVLWDEHLPNTTAFERSQEWSSYTGLTAFTSTFNHLHQFFLGISWS